MKKFISFLVISTLFMSFTFSKNTFTNPVWGGADPWMTQQGGNYIFCASQNNGIAVSQSPILTKKGEMKQIWSSPTSGWNSNCIWAPEIHFIDGRWYVYYAAGVSGPPYIHQRAGVLRSKTKDVFSQYEDMGLLYTGENSEKPESNIWAIDMTVFKHKNKLYAIWSGWEKQVDTDATPQQLYIQEMANPYTLKGKRVLLSNPDESWETGGALNLNEGPEVLQHKNQVFVVYSCRESWTPEYRQGMLQLKNPDGNLLDKSNWIKKGPVFEGNSQVLGIGHCSFVKSPNGKEDWIVYHSKKTTTPGWDRDVRMQSFTWNADGTPNFGTAIAAGVELKRPAGEVKLDKTVQFKAPISKRWTIQQANAWQKENGWLRGSNFNPSTAINQLETWQAESFDTATINRELGWAEKIGMNCMRVYLHHVAWEVDKQGFKNRLDKYLEIANSHNIKTIFVIFDDCWNPTYQAGKQPDPKPGVHNSGWVRDPGDLIYQNPALINELEVYVKDLLTSFKNDKRIVLWDLYNEPGNSDNGNRSLPLLKKVFEWGWAVRPSQPMSSGVWKKSLTDLNEFQLDNSDIITYHNYEDPIKHQEAIDTLKRFGRPLVCTEYMARRNNSLFQNIMPMLKNQNISAINWGLVSGKSNTKYAWDEPMTDGSEPKLWFHEIFHADGTPYKQEEVDLIKSLTKK